MIGNEWINACNATLNFGYMNGHSSYLPRLNYGCKIECLQEGNGEIILELKRGWVSLSPKEIVLNRKESPKVELPEFLLC